MGFHTFSSFVKFEGKNIYTCRCLCPCQSMESAIALSIFPYLLHSILLSNLPCFIPLSFILFFVNALICLFLVCSYSFLLPSFYALFNCLPETNYPSSALQESKCPSSALQGRSPFSPLQEGKCPFSPLQEGKCPFSPSKSISITIIRT